jgi:hypothetical protein
MLLRHTGRVEEQRRLILRQVANESFVESDVGEVGLNMSDLSSLVRWRPFSEWEMDLGALGATTRLPEGREAVTELVRNGLREQSRETILHDEISHLFAVDHIVFRCAWEGKNY